MPYISKAELQAQQERAQWVGLSELVEIVQAESNCSIETAREQIRNALADGAIWPLHWEPAPPKSAYCHPRREGGGARIPGWHELMGLGEPGCPPPSVGDSGWADYRSVSHWQAVEIDWEQGQVLDDFERDAYPRMRKEWASVDLGAREPPKPQRPKWRTLLLDREACERFWPRCHAAPSPAIAPESRSGIRTTAAANAERTCEEWIATLTERPINKESAFKAAQNAVGNNLTRKAFERVWARAAPTEWKAPGRRKQ